MCKSMDSIISVSFKKTQCEQQLLQDINDASGFIGKSTWIKIACMEKLERDCNGENKNQYINYSHKNNQQSNDNVNINSNKNNIVNNQCNNSNNSLLDVNLGF